MKPQARYAGLWAPEEFWFYLAHDPDKIKAVCNGVGSPSSWTYHLTPNTIWGLDITAAADIHDWMYTYPPDFATEADALAYKEKADRVFRNNLIRIFEQAEAQPGFKGWMHRRIAGVRRARAQEYFMILQNFGGTSFWEGKNKPENITASLAVA